MKKILLTGGGTAGHVTPHLALLRRLRELGYEIHYVGTIKGIEYDLIHSESGIQYHAISAGKLRRYFDFKNLTDIFRIGFGFIQALILLLRIRPSVVFSKGGFVSCPVVWASWLLRTPVLIHESDSTPGLANRLSIPFASKICYSFPETARLLPTSKGVLTGIPVRDILFNGNAEEGRKFCGFRDDKPVIMVIGGSLGATAINAAVRDSLDSLIDNFNICHICGKGNRIEDNRRGYAQFEYVKGELPHLFALADIVISRSGATSIFELISLKKPNLLIPLPLSASRGDQIHNARAFEKLGYSRVLPQEQLTPQTLIDNVNELYEKRDVYVKAMENAGELQKKAVNAVIDILVKLEK